MIIEHTPSGNRRFCAEVALRGKGNAPLSARFPFAHPAIRSLPLLLWRWQLPEFGSLRLVKIDGNLIKMIDQFTRDPVEGPPEEVRNVEGACLEEQQEGHPLKSLGSIIGKNQNLAFHPFRYVSSIDCSLELKSVKGRIPKQTFGSNIFPTNFEIPQLSHSSG